MDPIPVAGGEAWRTFEEFFANEVVFRIQLIALLLSQQFLRFPQMFWRFSGVIPVA
jgi:fumarate reductase subunit C